MGGNKMKKGIFIIVSILTSIGLYASSVSESKVVSSVNLDAPHLVALWNNSENEQIDQAVLLDLYNVKLKTLDEFAQRKKIKEVKDSFKECVNAAKSKAQINCEVTISLGEYDFDKNEFPVMFPNTEGLMLDYGFGNWYEHMNERNVSKEILNRFAFKEYFYSAVVELPEELRSINMDPDAAEKLISAINENNRKLAQENNYLGGNSSKDRKVTVKLVLEPIKTLVGEDLVKNVFFKVKSAVIVFDSTRILKKWKSNNADKKSGIPKIDGLWTCSYEEIVHDNATGEDKTIIVNCKIQIYQSRAVISGHINRAHRNQSNITGSITKDGDVEIQTTEIYPEFSMIGQVRTNNQNIIDATIKTSSTKSVNSKIILVRESAIGETKQKESKSDITINKNLTDIGGSWKGINKTTSSLPAGVFEMLINVNGDTFEGTTTETIGTKVVTAKITDGTIKNNKDIMFIKTYNEIRLVPLHHYGTLNDDGSIQGRFDIGENSKSNTIQGTFELTRD
jgi:hypothetical protein